METSELISICLSSVAVVGTLFTYIKHDKKIKTQEAKLNQYQISQIEEEVIEKKKALVKANIFDEGPAGKKLKIFNAGKAKATNIRLEFLDGINSGQVNMSHFPYRLLNPLDNTEVLFNKYSCVKPTITVKLTWDDDFQMNNEFEQDFTVKN